MLGTGEHSSISLRRACALEFGFGSVGTGEPLKVESSERQEQNAV